MFKVIQNTGHQPHNKNERLSIKFFKKNKTKLTVLSPCIILFGAENIYPSTFSTLLWKICEKCIKMIKIAKGQNQEN